MVWDMMWKTICLSWLRVRQSLRKRKLSKLEWFRLGDEVSRRQWDDVVGVLRVQHNALDRGYLLEWARQLGIADLVEKAWRESET